jgi:hypothetical protein
LLCSEKCWSETDFANFKASAVIWFLYNTILVPYCICLGNEHCFLWCLMTWKGYSLLLIHSWFSSTYHSMNYNSVVFKLLIHVYGLMKNIFLNVSIQMKDRHNFPYSFHKFRKRTENDVSRDSSNWYKFCVYSEVCVTGPLYPTTRIITYNPSLHGPVFPKFISGFLDYVQHFNNNNRWSL